MSFAELPDDVVLDQQPAAPPQPAAPALTIAPTKATDYQSHMQALVDAGASKQQIIQYAQQNGVDPSLIHGIDEALAYRDKGGKGVKVFVDGDQAAAQQPVPTGETPGFTELPADVALDDNSILGQVGRGLGLGARGVIRGVGQLTDLVAAPLSIIDRVDAAVRDRPVDPESYADKANNVADWLGLPSPQTGAEKVNDAALAAATGAVIPAGIAAPFAEAAPVAASLASSSAAQLFGGAGAGAGGEIAKQHGAGAAGQLGASLAGGLLSAAPAAANAAARAGNALIRDDFSAFNPSKLLEAFQRQQVRPMAAQVGGFGSKAMTSGAKATLGGLPLAAAAEKSIASAKAARDRLATSMGAVLDDTGAGQAVQRGAHSFIEKTGAKATKLYDAIPIPVDKNANLSNTKQALADLNAGLPSNKELSALLSDGRLQRFEQSLTPRKVLVEDKKLLTGTRMEEQGGKLSWGDLKSFRSYIGELAGRQTLQESTSKDSLQRLYAGLSEDMRATAQDSGPGALKAFTRANSFYAARQGRINNTLKLILGNDFQKSPESAFGQIDRWAREGGDSARLARTIRSLPEDEASAVRATIFSRLGRASPGQQSAAGDAFSPASFGTQWSKLDHRAKSILFPGTEYRQSLDDIANIAESMKASEKFANTSGTALAERLGNNLLGASVVGYILHPTAAITGEGIGYSAGLLLGSPRFARWLASSVRKPVGPATLAHINRLSSIAAAEPQIGNEVLALQQRLASAFVQSPMRAAAGSPDTSQTPTVQPQGQMEPTTLPQ